MLASAYSFVTTNFVPVVLAGAGFGVLITVHELGHFLFCKLFGIGTPVFSIGFGPTLIHKKIGLTDFRLSLIPLGGYCAVQDGTEKGDDPKASLSNKPYWQQTLMMLGGILCNILFAYAAFTAVHYGSRPKLKTTLTISQVVKNSAAAAADLQVGDQVLGYNDVAFIKDSNAVHKELHTFLKVIADSPDTQMILHLRSQDGCEHNKVITLQNKSGTGSLGIGIDMLNEPIPGIFEYDSFSSALHKGIAMTHQNIRQSAHSFLMMFKRRTLNGIGGPIAIFSQTFKMAKNGIRGLLQLLGSLSVGLAVLNFVPIAPLDGGRWFFLTIEAIIRRPLHEKVKDYIIIASLVLFALLFLVLSYRDFMRLLGY